MANSHSGANSCGEHSKVTFNGLLTAKNDISKMSEHQFGLSIYIHKLQNF